MGTTLLSEYERRATVLDATDPPLIPAWRRELPARRVGHSRVAYLAGHEMGALSRRTACSGTAEEEMGRLVGADATDLTWTAGPRDALDLALGPLHRPGGTRRMILTDAAAEPQLCRALAGQAERFGYDAARFLARLRPRFCETGLRTADVIEYLRRYGHEYATVFLRAMDPMSARLLDIEAVTAAAHNEGCVVGWDLSDVVGDRQILLADWGVDFACWSTAGYLNAGPGGPVGVFFNRGRAGAPRVTPSVDDAYRRGVLSARLEASLAALAGVGAPALAARGSRLSAYLRDLVVELVVDTSLGVEVLGEPASAGSVVGLRVASDARELATRLRRDHDVVVSVHEPDVVTLGAAAGYVTYHDCWRAAAALLDEASAWTDTMPSARPQSAPGETCS